MGEHTAIADRLDWLRARLGPGSPHQSKQAEDFINSLSESGYGRLLDCIIVVREARMFAGAEVTEHDLATWPTLPQDVQGIVLLAGCVLNNDRLTGEQAELLIELQGIR